MISGHVLRAAKSEYSTESPFRFFRDLEAEDHPNRQDEYCGVA